MSALPHVAPTGDRWEGNLPEINTDGDAPLGALQPLLVHGALGVLPQPRLGSCLFHGSRGAGGVRLEETPRRGPSQASGCYCTAVLLWGLCCYRRVSGTMWAVLLWGHCCHCRVSGTTWPIVTRPQALRRLLWSLLLLQGFGCHVGRVLL